jgi:hypothetical protein
MFFLFIVFGFVINSDFFFISLAFAPGFFFTMITNFVSFEDRKFVIRKLFRQTLMFNADQFESVSQQLISIPGSNTLKIHFKTGDSFSFLGGGKRRPDVMKQIQGLQNN